MRSLVFRSPGSVWKTGKIRPDNRMQVLKAVYELPVELPEEVEE